MKKNSKLSFPKIQKKVSDFITDETWSVTTKAAIAVWAAWAIWVWINEAIWACSVTGQHFSWNTNWHYNWSWTSWYWWTATFPSHSNGCSEDSNGTNNTWCTPVSCNDINWVVNWHYNITPTCSSDVVTSHCSHFSSGSGSSSSWDSCG
jgi:hypothetical protein